MCAFCKECLRLGSFQGQQAVSCQQNVNTETRSTVAKWKNPPRTVLVSVHMATGRAAQPVHASGFCDATKVTVAKKTQYERNQGADEQEK